MTPEKRTEYVQFLIWTLPIIRQEGDTLVDDLNRQVKFIKGRDILTYYIPTDPTKEKEPVLNKNLQKKWL